MNNIIRFENCIQRNGESMRFEGLLKNLEQNRKDGYEYSLGEIKQIANSILSELDYYSGKGATPIVKIAKEFDFKTYKQELTQGLSGDININGDTLERYGHDKVIIVNKEEELFHQRFVVAHELAHYLFEYIGNPEYRDPAVKFSDTYFNPSMYVLYSNSSNVVVSSVSGLGFKLGVLLIPLILVNPVLGLVPAVVSGA